MQTELESWSEALRLLPRRVFVPWSKADPVPRIRFLRVLALTMVAWLLVLLVVLLFTADVGGSYPSGWLYGWAGITAASLSIGFWLRTRRNQHFVLTSNPATAHRLYTSRMLIVLAMAEIPALVGFIVCFVVDAVLPYVIALPVSLALMYRDGPTARDVRMLQGWLDEYQDPYDLGAVLMAEPGSPAQRDA
jgi:hypothetical protein